MPSNAGGGAIDNLHSGGTTINCPAGSGLLPGQLTLIAVNVLGTGVTITPPIAGLGMPAWNQLGCPLLAPLVPPERLRSEITSRPSSGTKLVLRLRRTRVVSPSGLNPSSRAACAGVTYTNTCLMDSSPCSNPIFDYNSGSAALSNSVVTTGTNVLPKRQTGGKLGVPTVGLVVAFYGSSDPFSEYGINANSSSNSNGTAYSPSNGTVGPGLVGPVTGRFQVNGGIDVFAKNMSSVVDGPFNGTLPLRNDPTGGLAISSITGNGTTAAGTTTTANTLLIGTTPGYVLLNSNAGFNTPSGTVVPMTVDGNQNFHYSNATVGTGTGGNLFLQDPAAGDSVVQTVSILPQF